MTTQPILVIDDNPTLRHAISSYLEERGYAVRAAADGKEGLEIARRDLPAAILADLMMPRMDGRELAARIREDAATRHIPVIVFTATDMSEEERERSGFVAYLRKPVDPATLMSTLEEALGAAPEA